jgi:hypothetical protein
VKKIVEEHAGTISADTLESGVRTGDNSLLQSLVILRVCPVREQCGISCQSGL